METKMATSIVVLVLILAITANVSSSKSGHCPLARTITNCMNRCKSDYDCSGNKKCCPSSCGSTACADVSAVATSNGRDYGNSVYCSNVKCQPGEKCVLDKRTKREKCGRA